MAKVASPRIYDPYLGEMFGNILDQYDNPTYNLKLYLQPPSVTPDKHDPTSKNIVVLAQTAVTGTQIDNLEITFTADATGGDVLNARFTLKQPGAANFIDQLQFARKYLGEDDTQLANTEFKLWLDIKFLGYDHNPDNNEEGGEPTQIGETVTYCLSLTKFDVRVDQTGSEYNFETTYENVIAYSDQIYKFPVPLNISGKTITECFKDLETQYNKYLASNADQYERPDTVSFNLSELIGGTTSPTTSNTAGTATSGSSASTSTAASARADTPSSSTSKSATSTTSATKSDSKSKSKKISDKIETPATNPQMDASTTDSIGITNQGADAERRAGESSTGAGRRQESTEGKIIIPLLKDDTIHKAAITICGHSLEFQKLVTRKESLSDPSNQNVNNEQTLVYWLGIHAQAENTEWDKKRNRYTKKYTYTPYLTQDARSDIALTTKETSWLTEKLSESSSDQPSPTALATKRLQDLMSQGMLHKSYFYIFTGLNDQIINLDINYDNAQTLLLPPKGGMIGDYAIVNAPMVSQAEPANKDLTLGDQIEAASKENKKESLIGLFKKLKGAVSDVQGLASRLGRSVEEINAAITDTTGATAKRLAGALDSRTINAALSNVTTKPTDGTATPTSIAQVEVESIGAYAPEVSGYIYAADIIQPNSGLSAEEIEKAGLTKGPSTPANIGPAAQITVPLSSPLSGMTANGPSSMLMGYVYRNREETNFLLNIAITLRGDPYWLVGINGGPFKLDGQPSPDKITQPTTSSPYFLLTVGSPSRYDFIIDDEDSNPGYWGDNRASTTFSGLYYPINWTCKFSSGIFTTEVNAAKEIAVPLNWIKPVPPGQAPVDWKSIGVTDDAYTAYRALQPTYNPNADSPTDSDKTITPGSPSSGGDFRAVYGSKPTVGGQATDLARKNLGIGTGKLGEVTEADIKKLGTFTSAPPKATGDLAKDAKAIEAWGKANGFRVDENQYMGNGSVDPNAHSRGNSRGGGSHYDGRGSDWNIPGYGGDNFEARDPYAGYRMDEAAKLLRGAGYNVIWRSRSDHNNHMHIEVPKG